MKIRFKLITELVALILTVLCLFVHRIINN